MVIPLPPTALGILQLLRRLAPVGCEWVFPSPDADRSPLSDSTLIHALIRLQSDGRLCLPPDEKGTPRRLNVHDLRRSWASWAASDDVGANPVAVELVLGHSLDRAAGLSSSIRSYIHSKVAARDQGAALVAVDAFYREQWAKPEARVVALPSTATQG